MHRGVWLRGFLHSWFLHFEEVESEGGVVHGARRSGQCLDENIDAACWREEMTNYVDGHVGGVVLS